MDNDNNLNSIFDFFELIIKYYKFLRKNEKYNFKIPSQVDIGSAFGGLASNYSSYRKDRRLPNLWEHNTPNLVIIDDIYKRLYNADLIPQEQLYKKKFCDFLNNEIKNKLKASDESTSALFTDMSYYDGVDDYEKFIKCIIEYSNRKIGCIYISKLGNNKQNELSEQENIVSNYKNAIKERINKIEWLADYQKKYEDIRTNFVVDNNIYCVKESVNTFEQLFRELYQLVLFYCDQDDRIRLTKVENQIGEENSTIDNFNLSQLVDLFEMTEIYLTFELYDNFDLKLIKSVDLKFIIELNEECAYNNRNPDKFETQFVIQCLSLFLVGFKKLVIHRDDYLFEYIDEKAKIRDLESKLYNKDNEYLNTFKMYTLDENPEIWEGFIGNFYAFNPSWQTENLFNEDFWYKIHKNRYENPEIITVEYIISKDSKGGGLFDKDTVYFGLNPFIEYMNALKDEVSNINDKLRIYLCENLNSRISYFIGKTSKGVKSIILLNEKPFIEDEYPTYSFVSTNMDIYRLLKKHFCGNMTKYKRYNLEELIKSNFEFD
jgi:hypothetical protein